MNSFVQIVCAFLPILFLISCQGYQPPSVDLAASGYRDFTGERREVWTAVITTLSEKESIRNTDAKNGIVRTDYETLEDKESAKKLQYSFLVKLDELSKRTIRVYANIRFILPGQPAWMEDLQSQPVRNEKAEDYLRADLFESICANLAGCKPQPVSVVTAPVILEGREETPSGPPSAEVQEAQRLLGQNGYYPDSESGLLGRKTRSALKEFQKDYGLPVTGRPDAQTLGALRALRNH